LMGYGFCIVDNPHESISLKLPSDTTIYSITRHDLAPTALVQKFCETTPLTWRERLTGIKSKRNLYEGYISMLRAFTVKMSVLGDVPYDLSSEAETNAALYRTGQRDLYILAYNHIVGLMESIVRSERLLSMNDVLRGQKRRKKKRTIDPDEMMIKWFCQRISKPTDLEMSDETRQYLECLVKTFYERVDWIEYDGIKEEIKEECADLHQKLLEKGVDISVDMVRILWQIWQDESVEILAFPDPKECFGKYKEVKELREALTLETLDTVLLKDKLKDPGGGKHWNSKELIDLGRKDV